MCEIPKKKQRERPFITYWLEIKRRYLQWLHGHIITLYYKGEYACKVMLRSVSCFWGTFRPHFAVIFLPFAACCNMILKMLLNVCLLNMPPKLSVLISCQAPSRISFPFVWHFCVLCRISSKESILSKKEENFANRWGFVQIYLPNMGLATWWLWKSITIKVCITIEQGYWNCLCFWP